MEYTIIKIPKRSGGFRTIYAPSPELKEKQRKLLKILEKTSTITGLRPTPFMMGFMKNRSILENAKQHQDKKYVINIDIENFFNNCKKSNMPEDLKSALKMLKPPKSVENYLSEEEIEFLKNENIEEIIFYEDFLPQGAPTSPFLSNFWLREADFMIVRVLKDQISDDIRYTRYADDITISSNSKAIFAPITLEIIEKILNKHGFKINTKKIKKMTQSSRKEVTGLVVNSGKPTVSKKFRLKVRAAVHNFLHKKEYQTEEEKRKILGWLGFVHMTHPELAKKMMEKVNQVKI